MEVVLTIVLIFFGIRFFWSKSAEPVQPIDKAKELKSFLGVDFGNDYAIIQYSSRPRHPDSPMSIAISLSETDFEMVKKFLSTINLEEVNNYSKDKKVKYTEQWMERGDKYYKNYSATRQNDSGSEYPFFNRRLAINAATRIISYKEFMI